MTEEERVKRNEAIARFLGWEKSFVELSGENLWFPPADSNFPYRFYEPEFLDFHGDWNSLARAIEKICRDEDSVGFHVLPKPSAWEALFGKIPYSVQSAPTMIEAAWMAVSSYCLTFETPSLG